MHLMEAIERLQKRNISYSTQAGTIYRVFEVYEMYGKDASGNVPVFVNPEILEKTKKNKIN